jgi:hypothetical protein
VKLHRKNGGSYTTTVYVRYRNADGSDLGQGVEICVADIERTEGGAWYWTITRTAGTVLGGEDHYSTRRDALLGLDEAVRRGFYLHKTLGWCLMPETSATRS